MLGADRQGQDRFDAVGQGLDGFAVERLGDAEVERRAALGRRDNLLRRHDVIVLVEDHLIVARQPRFHGDQVAARHQYARLVPHVSSFRRKKTDGPLPAGGGECTVSDNGASAPGGR